MLELEPRSESFRKAQKNLQALTAMFMKYRDKDIESARESIEKAEKEEEVIKAKLKKLSKILKPYKEGKKEPDERFDTMHKEYYKQLVNQRRSMEKQQILHEMIAKGTLGDYDKQSINITDIEEDIKE